MSRIRNTRQHDDIDDIMASIMQSNSGNGLPSEIPPSAPKRSFKASPSPSTKVKKSRTMRPNYKRATLKHSESAAAANAGMASVQNIHRQSPNNRERYPVGSTERPSKDRNFLKAGAISIFVVSTVITGGLFLWNGPISDAFKPKSPFSSELSSKMNLSLYYPTKLPGSFKMEVNSISAPESDVLVYVISDDKGKKINVSLQRQPSDINLSSLYKTLKNTSEFETKFGKVVAGTSDNDMEITNILTGRTWIILTSDTNTISQDELQTVVDGLEL